MMLVVIIINIYSDLVCMCLMRWGQPISAKLLLCFHSGFRLQFVCISPCPVDYFHSHSYNLFSFSYYSTNGFLSLWVRMCLRWMCWITECFRLPRALGCVLGLFLLPRPHYFFSRRLRVCCKIDISRGRLPSTINSHRPYEQRVK